MENSFHCLFGLPEAACIPWLLVPLNLQASNMRALHFALPSLGSSFQFPLPPLYCCIKFLIAILINNNKYTGIRTYLLSYSSEGQKSEMALTVLKSRWQQGCIPARKESISLLFPASRGHLHCWMHGTFLNFHNKQRNTSRPLTLTLRLLCGPISFLYCISSTSEDPCDYIGPTQLSKLISPS